MSDFNPYMDIRICDPHGTQNIACLVAVYHHSDDETEHDEFQVGSDTGSETW
jgi:hypothetical protein